MVQVWTFNRRTVTTPIRMTDKSDDTVERDPQTGKKRDTETGAFVAEYDKEQFVDAVEALWPEEFPTTSRIADEVGISRRGAYNYLVQLEEDGRLQSRESGPAKVWMPTDD